MTRMRLVEAFAVKDCALLTLATGRRAHNLRELRDHVREVAPASIYHHFWAGLLRPGFDDPEFNNDFAAWAQRALHDRALAERLGMVDPTAFADLEALRRELIEIIEERLDERELVPWARPDDQFSFINSQIVVFDTHRRLATPMELVAAVPGMSSGSIFYHFIDARRRRPDGGDDFCAWLRGWGDDHGAAIARLQEVDPFFLSLSQLRARLAGIFAAELGGRAA